MADKKALVERMKRMGDTLSFRTPGEIKAFEKEAAELTQVNRKIAGAIKKDASKHVQQQLSFLPTKTTRTSLFAPLADQELKSRYTELEFKSAWGKLTVSGPPLNITDEGIFLALLYYVKEKQLPIVKVNFKQICEMLGITVQGKNYRRIKQGIKKLVKTSFDFELKDGTWTVEHILKQAKGSKDYTVIEIDAWFYNKFLAGEITLIDMTFRKGLRGDICKALYRFIASHRGTQRYNTTTLIDALNLNPDRELRKNRDALKRAFAQLRNKKFLSFKYKNDLFYDIKKE